MADRTGSKPAPKRGRPPKKDKSSKSTPYDTRVYIGSAFQRWRELKTAKGFRNDAEVALSLLDVRKRSPPRPASSGASAKKIKFSQVEVETLIEQEVHTAVQKKETKLQGLIETIQQLDRAVDYESSIQKLEARINTVTKRAEAAIAFMTEEQKKTRYVDVQLCREHSEDETLETASQSDRKSMDESREVFQMMENAKEALKKMKADNEALKGARTDLSEELPLPVLTPYSSPDGKELKLKKELEYKQETKSDVEEPKTGPAKEESLPLCESNAPKHTTSERDKLLYPPLPSNTFPSTLSMEAYKFNIPQRLQVQLALIRKPAGLSVLWTAEEKDPSETPMASYRLFMTVEKDKGSNVFPDWTSLEVEAKPLPMCVMTSKYQAGRKICVAVVGKDTFGRYGPYSEVVTASLPD